MAKKATTKAKKPKAKKITVSKVTTAGKVTPVLTTNLIDDVFSYLSKLTADYKTSREDREAAAKEALIVITPDLFAAGIFKVHASYSGEGDSGDIDGVYATDVNGNYFPWPDSLSELRDRVRKILWAFIPGGFEINDGSMGEITLELSTRKFLHEHKERIIDYEESTRNFDF